MNRVAIQSLVKEIDVQRAIVEYLKLRRLIVLTTNVSVRKAAAAAGRDAVGHVCSPGVPDLLVSSPSWPTGLWLGLEVKRPSGGKLSPAQRDLRDAGRIVVVTSIEEAGAAVDQVKASLRSQFNGGGNCP